MSELYFTQDQRPKATVTYWDTPFTALEGGVASSGIRMTVLNPIPGAAWGLKAVLRGTLNASVVTAFESASTAQRAVYDGRTDVLAGYWAAGAPGWHGATTHGKVAYSWSGVMRSVAGRGWFSTDANPTWHIALAGSGYVRVDIHRPSAVVRTVFAGQLSEESYLTDGFQISTVIDAADAGATIRVYYAQDEADRWGGVVVKAVAGAPAATVALRQAAAAAAPVLACDLIDDGAPPTAYELPLTDDVEVSFEADSPATASFTLPLVNADVHDGVGYELYRAAPGALPTLRSWDNGVVATTLKAFRLIQVKATVTGETAVPIFTGILEDFADASSGKVRVPATGLDHRMQQFDKNLPDKISYMTKGYRRLSGTVEPVYDVPAFDNWPLEHAIAELMTRSGIVPSRMTQRVQGVRADGALETVALAPGASTYYTFRARTMSDRMLRLGRAVHYGNTGLAFTEAQPLDDEYLFKPENTQRLWERAKSLTAQYGYDLRFAPNGSAVLAARNNAAWAYDFAVSDLTAGAGTLTVHPSAVRGTYVSSSNGTFVKRVWGSRIDLLLGLSTATRQHVVTVTRVRDSAVVATRTLTATGTEEAFFYDFRETVDGANACRTTIYPLAGQLGAYEQYDVQVAAGTGSGAMRLDSVLTYVVDPMTPTLPQTLSTDLNAIDVQGESAIDEMRNFVIVVGRRKATVTDSAKFGLNAENPEGEFIVEAAVDAASVADPTAQNFVGYPRQAVIYDTEIADHDHAAWLARTFIQRQRLPKASAPIEHSLLPSLSVRQPVFAEELRYGTVAADTILYVSGYKHRIAAGQALTSIQTTAYPEFASYEPREDVDIDTYFGGKPIYNVEVSYTGLSGATQTNLGPQTSVVTRSTDDDIVLDTVATAVSPRASTMLDLSGMPWPPVPGSMLIRPISDGTTPILTLESAYYPSEEGYFEVRPNQQLGVMDMPVRPTQVRVQAYVRNVLEQRVRTSSRDYDATEVPNTTLMRVYWNWDAATKRITFRMSGGSSYDQVSVLRIYVTYRKLALEEAWLGDTPYHHFMNVDYRNSLRGVELPWQHGDDSSYYNRPTTNTYEVRYRRLGPVDVGGAFVDPYAGGSPFFDVTTSELGYLAQVKFDALVTGNYRVSVRNAQTHQVVAYLTEPTADPNDPEQHYTYMQAGVNKQFAWDGVDQVGAWNQLQSQTYAQSVAGSFTDGAATPIGRGYLVWNQEVGNPAPLALISGSRDATGKPIFGVGTFAQWYVSVEVDSDSLRELAELAPTDPSRQIPRIARTDDETVDYTTAATSAFIYTHMPAPLLPTLTVHNWIGAAYDAEDLAAINNAANWSQLDGDNPDAIVRNDRPVRVRFALEERPGTLWSGKTDDIRVKLTRQAHLKATIMDQFVVWDGTFYPNSTTEKRTIVSRRLMNDTHTFSFEDNGYRKAGSFKAGGDTEGTEWIFLPSELRKNWRGVENEPLVFGDYLQLEEVPKYSASRTPSGERSRFQVGFINYLFYLSAFVTDTTGRSAWAVNRTFLDPYKLVGNTYDDWWDPATPWTAANASTYRTPSPADPVTQHRRTFVVRQWLDDAYTTDLRTQWQLTSSSTVGYGLVRAKWAEHWDAASTIYVGKSGATTDEYSTFHLSVFPSQLSTFAATLATRQLGSGASALGLWTWELEPKWVPNVVRDFYPYHLVPPMVDKPNTLTANSYRTTDIYRQVDSRERNTESSQNQGDDVAAGDTWSSAVRDMTTAGTRRFYPGTKVTADTAPTQTIHADHADYVRQDELVHYEDLRGMFSRGPRPAEAPKKITPVTPYFVNPYWYTAIEATAARKNGTYPNFRAAMYNPFDMKFRSEYYWESATMFPVNDLGVERLEAANHTKTGAAPQRWDAGAWTGWKDDDVPLLVQHGSATNIFSKAFMPVATGPRRTYTKDMIFNLVLVNERRDTAI